MRSYTVKEIDKMRDAIEFRWLYGKSKKEFGDNNYCLYSRTYDPEDKTKIIEERLRTYMLAGINPEDL